MIGHLAVLTVRMNPDLAMAEELLKKTRTGNLFTVFGQPDIDEAAWASLNSTDSRPFPRPDSGRIAVEVINPRRRRDSEGVRGLSGLGGDVRIELDGAA